MPTTLLPRRHPGSLAPAFALAFALTIAVAHARADCIEDAAVRHGVNADVLRAIGWHESRLRPDAIGRNTDGSVDLGAFQINSVHLRELAQQGIDRAALGDGCVSAEVAAWHYRRQVDALGDTWQAVGAYHSRTTARARAYANRIAAILRRWNRIPPGAPPLPAPERTPGPSRSAATVPAAPATPGAADTRAFGEIAFVPTAR